MLKINEIILNLKQQRFKYLAFLIIIIFAFLKAIKGGDFDVYLDAAQKMMNHQNIYVAPFIKNLQYYYSPFFVFLLIPFSYLPFYIPEFFWLLLCAFFLFRIWELSIVYFDISKFSSQQLMLWGSITFFLILRFILYNFGMIQLTIFLLWASIESLHLLNNKKDVQGAALLALAMNIKLLPLLFLPYLFYRNYVKAGVFTLIIFLFCLIFPGIFLGMEYNLQMHYEWWKVINPSNKEHLLEAGMGTHSLVSLVPVYITDTWEAFGIKRNLVNLNYETVKIIVELCRLTLVALTLYFLRTMPFVKNKSSQKTYWEVSYICLVTPLLFPHQQKYAFMYVFPSVIYLTYYIITEWQLNIKRAKWLLVFYIPVFIEFSPIIGSDIIGRSLYQLFDYFRILSFATLFQIVFLMICVPKNSNNSTLEISES